ncbi:anti-sigma factor [Rhizocola hellebori]|uniref:Anti-sigma factor n=1 Tax=Rhizocola hellebori TaxID=1392758 RepID=A0A8J3Q734_9ACTN|nr:zf-HC2 domain-containing protein [Rhizocola hellebori]GIH05268.1 anti-sigma factor [Rhizocola hellebori]
MNCDEFVELVTAYLEGALDEATQQRFAAHLSECDGCERYLDQIRQTVQTLATLPPHSLGGQARDRLLEAFREFHR